MKTVIIIFALIAVALAQETIYTSKYDNIDVLEIVKSDRLFKNYYNCLLEQGKCPPDAAELKRVLPEALETDCAKCSPKQKESSDKAIEYLSANRPEEWAALKAKYDPENKYVEKYRENAEKIGIKL
ncbi:ejaculatory bulb-specific protein 3-like [Uranotaenia lowii]|uniref:ejaculatory bulb-specific protein 3-like n=1 Tax=Uranotaenia lowii TaxID=190385 RepID=UPI002478BB7F|nr:ejaculatory bulb-specific protein 3-like [Uranotaenia lowii]